MYEAEREGRKEGRKEEVQRMTRWIGESLLIYSYPHTHPQVPRGTLRLRFATGHALNIFSVKSPHCAPEHIFTASQDSEVVRNECE
jgi:hypothetical protein